MPNILSLVIMVCRIRFVKLLLLYIIKHYWKLWSIFSSSSILSTCMISIKKTPKYIFTPAPVLMRIVIPYTSGLVFWACSFDLWVKVGFFVWWCILIVGLKLRKFHSTTKSNFSLFDGKQLQGVFFSSMKMK